MSPARATPSAIYAIADAEALAPRSLAAGARAMAEAGIGTVQLRAKRMSDRDLHAEAERAVRALEGWSGTLWIDDRVDLALLLGFAGVHLGQRDLPPAAARALLPEERLIGASSHDRAQFAAASADAVYSSESSLTATRRPEASSASYTVPMPPEPSGRSSR